MHQVVSVRVHHKSVPQEETYREIEESFMKKTRLMNEFGIGENL